MEKGKKYLHYCWFGDKKMPRSAKRCIKTWKKYLPEYEIICWNEKNVNVRECPFVEEAYSQKRWAFVADYVRVKALYEYGGIYLDTDMAIKKDVGFLLDDPAFVGIEDSGYVAAGVWGAKEPGSFLAKKVLEFYRRQAHFDDSDLYAITIPKVMTRILEGEGFQKGNDDVQIVHDTYVYPREYFYPLSYDRQNNVFTDNTCMVHYGDASWTSNNEKRDIRLIRMFGRKKARFLLGVASRIKALLRYYWNVLWRTVMLLLFPVRFIIRKIRKVHHPVSDASIVEHIGRIKTHYLVFAHDGWIGVEQSTKELFGDIVMIGDYDEMSNVEHIVDAVVQNKNIKMVVFSALGEGWEYLARKIKEASPGMVIKIFWHGSNAMHIEAFDWDRFNAAFGLLKDGIVDSVAFAKKSMYDQYKQLGYNVEFLPNIVVIDDKVKEEIRKGIEPRAKGGDVRIGIYASGDRWVKNLYNQMSAASLVEKAIIDMVPLSETALQFSEILKVRVEGERQNVSHEEMLQRIARDDVVLYTTFVECAPIMPLECMELGTLCITGDNHHYWTGTPLEKYLVEPKVDNPVAIAERINKCLKHKEEIMSLYAKWKKEYNKYSREELNKFLGN